MNLLKNKPMATLAVLALSLGMSVNLVAEEASQEAEPAPVQTCPDWAIDITDQATGLLDSCFFDGVQYTIAGAWQEQRKMEAYDAMRRNALRFPTM